MSRAFTKEVDDAPAPPLPERPTSGAPNLVTAEGAAGIEERLRIIGEQLREPHDTAKRAELHRDQRYWASRRASMQIVAADPSPTAVGFGVTVEIRRGGKLSRLRIVGEDQADPAHGRIAWTSPLAVALDGAAPGEVVEFEAGGRTDAIEIVSVSS